jgi:hypothetical protein
VILVNNVIGKIKRLDNKLSYKKHDHYDIMLYRVHLTISGNRTHNLSVIWGLLSMLNSDEYLFIYDRFDGIVLSTSRKLISNDY